MLDRVVVDLQVQIAKAAFLVGDGSADQFVDVFLADRRELENLARRLAALYPQEIITAAVLDSELAEPALSALKEEGSPDERRAAAV